MANNPLYDDTPGIGVRGTLESWKGVDGVGYDEATKGVTVDIGGKTHNLGNAGLTLGTDGRYYAPSEDYLKNLLVKQAGLVPLRNTAQLQGHAVGHSGANPIIDGQQYSTDGMVNIGGTQYVGQDFLRGLSEANPKYTNQYQGRQEDLFNRLYNSKFNYNPNTDRALQSAQQQGMRTVGEEMNSRGILDSTITQERSQRVAQDLIPQYEERAYGRYRDEKQDLMNLSSMLSNMSAEDRAVWEANETKRYNDFNLTYQAERNALDKEIHGLNKAYEKIEMLGYVDNETAVITGLPPGTPSAEARKRKNDMEDWYAMQDRQLEDRKADMDYQFNLSEKAKDSDFDRTLKLESAVRQMAIDFMMPEAEVQSRIAQAFPELYSSGKSSGGGGGGSGGGKKAATSDETSVVGAIDTALEQQGIDPLGSLTDAEKQVAKGIIDQVSGLSAEDRNYLYEIYGIGAPSAPATTDEASYGAVSGEWADGTRAYTTSGGKTYNLGIPRR